MLNIIKTLSVLAIAGVSLAAPASSSDDVTITVKNSCSSDLHIYKLDNGQNGEKSSQELSAGASNEYKVDGNWAGRF